MPFRFGPLELGIIAFVLLLVFGAKKLPQLGGGLGKGLREFKQGIAGATEEDTASTAAPKPAKETPSTNGARSTHHLDH